MHINIFLVLLVFRGIIIHSSEIRKLRLSDRHVKDRHIRLPNFNVAAYSSFADVNKSKFSDVSVPSPIAKLVTTKDNYGAHFGSNEGPAVFASLAISPPSSCR